MRTVLRISILLAFCFASCTKPLPEVTEPEVTTNAVSKVTVTFPALDVEGVDEVYEFEWNANTYIGAYGSVQGSNEKYAATVETVGLSTAEFYGDAIEGNLTLYIPYSNKGDKAIEAGRLEIPAVQTFNEDPLTMLCNTIKYIGVATSENPQASFDYEAGLLKIQLKVSASSVESVAAQVKTVAKGDAHPAGWYSLFENVTPRMTNASESVTVSYINGKRSTPSAPLTVWAVVAPGTYENIVVSVKDGEKVVNSYVKGPFVVEKRKVCNVVVTADKYGYGIDDFEAENGTYN